MKALWTFILFFSCLVITAQDESILLNENYIPNAGFERDDALLIVTFITDEEDNGSAGNPQDWFDDVVAAKLGDQDRVVVLGLFGDNDQPSPVCSAMSGLNGADAGPRLRQFAQLFNNHDIGSVCLPSYSQFFDDAVSTIDFACDNFPMPQ